jgi:hypothetical protein
VTKEDERVERGGCSDEGAKIRGLGKLECIVGERNCYSMRSSTLSQWSDLMTGDM